MLYSVFDVLIWVHFLRRHTFYTQLPHFQMLWIRNEVYDSISIPKWISRLECLEMVPNELINIGYALNRAHRWSYFRIKLASDFLNEGNSNRKCVDVKMAYPKMLSAFRQFNIGTSITAFRGQKSEISICNFIIHFTRLFNFRKSRNWSTFQSIPIKCHDHKARNCIHQA